MRCCGARVLAPYETHCLMKSGALGPGRLVRARLHGVARHRLGDRHATHELLERDDVGAGDRVLEAVRLHRRRRRRDLDLLIFREVVHDDVEHEPVELRLGQRIRALELDRVLRREDEERLLELVRLALHRHAMLLHRLEQRRLRLRRRAVDLVGEHDVREDRPGREHHVPAARLRIVLDDVGARDVARHQVRRELDARELEVEHLRDRVDQQRLRQARHADDQAVAAGEQRQQHELDHVLLADDELVQLGDDLVATGFQAVGERDVVGGLPAQGAVDRRGQEKSR